MPAGLVLCLQGEPWCAWSEARYPAAEMSVFINLAGEGVGGVCVGKQHILGKTEMPNCTFIFSALCLVNVPFLGVEHKNVLDKM